MTTGLQWLVMAIFCAGLARDNSGDIFRLGFVVFWWCLFVIMLVFSVLAFIRDNPL